MWGWSGGLVGVGEVWGFHVFAWVFWLCLFGCFDGLLFDGAVKSGLLLLIMGFSVFLGSVCCGRCKLWTSECLRAGIPLDSTDFCGAHVSRYAETEESVVGRELDMDERRLGRGKEQQTLAFLNVFLGIPVYRTVDDKKCFPRSYDMMFPADLANIFIFQPSPVSIVTPLSRRGKPPTNHMDLGSKA